ncbi:MAG TPA: glutamate-cysteine ligase family protein [Planctomycetota bacterium]|nr:glutamate-cysteine ligase family protein [Planctomycetota bacterium]
MSGARRLRLFEAYGIELEYMIVERESLDVCPISDDLLEVAAGERAADFSDGDIDWSNELVLHVIELKTAVPAPRLIGLSERFGASLRRIDGLLEPLGARLLPTAMHPWMDPQREMRLWPHDSQEIYAAFDRIFDCRGHGWANLQSMHLNLPFGDDSEQGGEFARLHAAIRVVLPILPALAASSPIVEGRVTGRLDTRLEVYRHNARRVPVVAGRVVPENASTRAQYEKEILGRIHADMAPHDPEGLLRHEWCNSRGAIARFDRSAIEIRVLDVAETPRADLAIAALVSAVVESLVAERHASLGKQQACDLEAQVSRLMRTIERAEQAPLSDPEYLALFGWTAGPTTAGELWRHIATDTLSGERREAFGPALETILERGPLARRILHAVGPEPSRERLREVYRELADCLLADRLFDPT